MKIFILFVLLCVSFLSEAQRRKNADSLLTVLPKVQGKEKVMLLHDLTLAYLGIDKDKTLLYAEQALKEAEALKHDSLTVSSLLYVAAAKENAGDYQVGLPLNLKAAELARKIGDNKQLSSALGHLSISYFQTQQLDKVLQTAVEGLELAKSLKDTIGMLNMIEMHAGTYKVLKNYGLAERYWKEEIELAQKINRRFELGRSYINLGVMYSEARRYNEAIAYLEKGIPSFKAMNYVSGEAIACLNLGDEYLRMENYAKSRANYEYALTLNKTVQNPSIEGNIRAGLGRIELESGHYEAAKTNLLQAEKLAKETNDVELLKGVYGYLEGYSMATHDFKNARVYHDKFTASADSLLSQKVTERITDFQVKYETAKKDQELAEQKSQNFRQRTWLIALAASMLALLVLGYLFYTRYRLRQKAALDAAVIKEQQLGLNAVIEAQEAERKRIAKDLHDGIAQELVALKLGFHVLQNKLEKVAPTEAQTLNELSEQLNESCTEVRNISHVMMPPTLEQHGLVPSLQMLLRNSLEHVGLQAEFEHFNLPERLDEKTELGLYRIAQELLNNILKHAQANKVVLQLYQAGNNLIMRIEDNGKSFDFDEARRKGSMGLLNILSRVSTLGGTYTSERGAEFGTVSTIRVPIG